MTVFDLVASLRLDSSKYDEGLNNAEKKTQSLSSSLKSAVKPLAAVGATGMAAGGAIFAYANNTSKAADQIDKMSQKLGLSAQAYQEWDYVLQISGTDIQNMRTGLKTLTNKFDDAKNGGSGAIETFERLGLSMEDIKDLSREDLFAKVIEGFQNMEDSTERAALANDLFGRSGQELAPLFNTTSEETKELIEKLHEVGGVMSDEAVKNGAKFQDSLTTLKTAFSGATNTLVGKFVPGIAKTMDKITDFVASGGLKNLLDTFKKLAPAIAGVTSALIAYKTAMGISAVITALTEATEGQTIAQALLNAVMNANPFVLVATLVIGLAAALITLWHTNDDFRAAVENSWGSLKSMFTALYDGFIGAVKYIPKFLSGIWDSVTTKVSDTISTVTGYFSNARENIFGIFTNLRDGITGKTKDISDAIIDGIGEAIKFIKSLPEEAIEWGHDLIKGFVTGIKDKVDDVGDAVGGMAKKVKNFIGFSEPEDGPLSNFHTFAPDMVDLFVKGIRDNIDSVKQASESLAMAIVPRTKGYTNTNFAVAGGGSLPTRAENIVIPVYIGGDMIDEIIVNSEQARNYRSGGR
jgi:hypothetical protein